MAQRAFADRLMDLCESRAGQIAEEWHRALIVNPRTLSFKSIPKEGALHQAIFIYKNLKHMYFDEDPYESVLRNLDIIGYAEDKFTRGVPLAEALYALILMRRHIWLYAELQELFNITGESNKPIQSINRVLLLFDYAIHITAQEYDKMSRR